MYNPVELQRIDRQIEDLQRLKSNIQSLGVAQPQQPINNIITTPQQMVPQQPIFEAKFTTENPSDIFVNTKTAFINLKDGKLSIKEVDGELKEYNLILPKDEKDIKIENLENKLKEMEDKLNNQVNNNIPLVAPINTNIQQPNAKGVGINEYTEYSEPIIKERESYRDDNEYVAKPKSKNSFFKSNG